MEWLRMGDDVGHLGSEQDDDPAQVKSRKEERKDPETAVDGIHGQDPRVVEGGQLAVERPQHRGRQSAAKGRLPRDPCIGHAGVEPGKDERHHGGHQTEGKQGGQWSRHQTLEVPPGAGHPWKVHGDLRGQQHERAERDGGPVKGDAEPERTSHRNAPDVVECGFHGPQQADHHHQQPGGGRGANGLEVNAFDEGHDVVGHQRPLRLAGFIRKAERRCGTGHGEFHPQEQLLTSFRFLLGQEQRRDA